MISVVIPTYNRAGTIVRSAKSVLDQSVSDIELIIVDDCSTDNTEKIVRSLADPRVRYIRLEKNSGACVARNTGIDNANGDYIAFQDSDDEWLSEKLEKQLDALKKYDADVCFCSKKRLSIDRVFSDITHTDLPDGIIPYNKLFQRSRVSTQTLIAKKEVFEQIRFDENVKKAQDYDWTLRAGEKFIFVFVPEPLVIQYMQADSLTIKGKNHETEIEMCEYFLSKYKEMFPRYPDLEVSLLNRLAAFKTINGEKADKEYKKLYITSRKTKFLIYYFLSKTKVLCYFMKLKTKKKNKVIYGE